MMFRTVFAVVASKTSAKLIDTLHLGSGTTVPGRIARTLDPDILIHLSRQIQQETIAVTGTNGKTTTCGLITQFLKSAHKQVIHNQLGANMLHGITAAFALQSPLSGSGKVDYGILEVDEASLFAVASEVPIQRVVVTNLFRDQLDRYGELDTTARLILKGMARTRGLSILNADDPLVAAMGFQAQVSDGTLVEGNTDADSKTALYFGVNVVRYGGLGQDKQQKTVASVCSGLEVPFQRESTDCPRCSHPLGYDMLIYGHLGHYSCPQCYFTRPRPTVVAEDVLVSPQHSVITLQYGAQTLEVTLPLPGLFNVYNFLAAVATVYDMGLPYTVIEPALKQYHSVFGRAERKIIQGKAVMTMLIKNPVGATEVLKLVGSDPKARLLIALNDDYADGRDISWIWDAMFEALNPAAFDENRKLWVTGTRAQDMAVRLKYAGIPETALKVEPNLETARAMAIAETPPDECLYVLPTYTALLQLKGSSFQKPPSFLKFFIYP